MLSMFFVKQKSIIKELVLNIETNQLWAPDGIPEKVISA